MKITIMDSCGTRQDVNVKLAHHKHALQDYKMVNNSLLSGTLTAVLANASHILNAQTDSIMKPVLVSF